MSELKGIPVVAESAPVARSGEKYVTPQGFTAIKDGIKPKREADRRGLLGKPRWLKAPLAAGAGYERVRRVLRTKIAPSTRNPRTPRLAMGSRKPVARSSGRKR